MTINHFAQLLALLFTGAFLAVVAVRWVRGGNAHSAHCFCQGCGERESSRYIDQLLMDRERRDARGRAA